MKKQLKKIENNTITKPLQYHESGFISADIEA